MAEKRLISGSHRLEERIGSALTSKRRNYHKSRHVNSDSSREHLSKRLNRHEQDYRRHARKNYVSSRKSEENHYRRHRHHPPRWNQWCRYGYWNRRHRQQPAAQIGIRDEKLWTDKKRHAYTSVDDSYHKGLPAPATENRASSNISNQRIKRPRIQFKEHSPPQEKNDHYPASRPPTETLVAATPVTAAALAPADSKSQSHAPQNESIPAMIADELPQNDSEKSTDALSNQLTDPKTTQKRVNFSIDSSGSMKRSNVNKKLSSKITASTLRNGHHQANYDNEGNKKRQSNAPQNEYIPAMIADELAQNESEKNTRALSNQLYDPEMSQRNVNFALDSSGSTRRADVNKETSGKITAGTLTNGHCQANNRNEGNKKRKRKNKRNAKHPVPHVASVNANATLGQKRDLFALLNHTNTEKTLASAADRSQSSDIFVHASDSARKTNPPKPELDDSRSIPDMIADQLPQNESLSNQINHHKLPQTHIIFALDSSGSMRRADVNKKSGKVSRWAAVFECIDAFLKNQLETLSSHAPTHQNHPLCLISALIFSEQSKILLKRAPLVGNGENVRQALKKAQKKNKPRGGTWYSTGFSLAHELAGYDNNKNKDSNVVLVFLSDGRPGDLQPDPPSLDTAMQDTFQRQKKKFPAAGHYIEKMQKQEFHLDLHFICLCNEGKPWLEYLAKRYNGQFHNPDLTLEENDSVPAVPRGSAVPRELPVPREPTVPREPAVPCEPPVPRVPKYLIKRYNAQFHNPDPYLGEDDSVPGVPDLSFVPFLPRVRSLPRLLCVPARKKSQLNRNKSVTIIEIDDSSESSDNSESSEIDGGNETNHTCNGNESGEYHKDNKSDESDDSDKNNQTCKGNDIEQTCKGNESDETYEGDESDEDDSDDWDELADTDDYDELVDTDESNEGVEKIQFYKGNEINETYKINQSDESDDSDEILGSIQTCEGSESDEFVDTDDCDKLVDTDDSSEDSSEDEVVEMKVKSQDTLIREKFLKAKSSGNVISLTGATTSSSSIRSTFLSISSSISNIHASKLRERGVTIMKESPMIACEATRMVLSPEKDKFIIARKESSNARRVKISLHPFAQGGLRNVYRMSQIGEARQVAKESRHDIKYQERLRFHFETVLCQYQATRYASSFNKHIMKLKQRNGDNHRILSIPRIEFLQAEVYRLKAPNCPGGFRYLAVEKEMKGEYKKWNNNNGYVNPLVCVECQVAQAFSHFSYAKSNHKEMVVDIQGSGFFFY